MFLPLFFICADYPKTSKVNRVLYPPAIIMENFISGIERKEAIQTTKTFIVRQKQIKDFCEWKGVTCQGAQVQRIDWGDHRLRGSLSMEWIPDSLEYLNASHNELTGEIALSCFPEVIITTVLDHNRLSGTIDFENMPIRLRFFCIGNNQFHGSFDMQSLPKEWKPFSIDISENAFSGSIDFAYIPRGVSLFDANSNKFSGSVRLFHLNECAELVQFYIRNNELDGDIDLHDVRFFTNLLRLDISENNFTGDAHLERLRENNAQSLSLCDISLNKLTVHERSAWWYGVFTGQQGDLDAPEGPRILL